MTVSLEPEFRLNLQVQFDLVRADRETGDAIHRLPTRTGLAPLTGLPNTA